MTDFKVVGLFTHVQSATTLQEVLARTDVVSFASFHGQKLKAHKDT